MKLSRYVGDKAFYRRVLAVAVPIMLQNGITNFVNMLDNLMVGRVGTLEMTGVAVANQLFFVFMLCMFGAVSGAGIFGAQFYGKGDHEGLRHSFRFKLLLCAALTALCAAVFWFGGEWLISQFLQGEGAAEDAAASLGYARNYLRIMMISMIPNALIQIYASTLRETGETLLSMKAGIIAVVVNLVLNAVLIFGYCGFPRLGVAGAAIATVVARFVEMFIVMIWTHAHKRENPFIIGAYRSMYIPLRLVKDMTVKGAPLLLNETLWSLGITMLNRCYSVRSLDVVAATNISQTFWNVFSVTFMSIGTSIGIIVGQLLGAQKFHEVRSTTRKLIAFSMVVSTVMAGIYILCSGWIPLLYNTTDTVRTLARGVIIISALYMPLDSFVHATYFSLRSGGKTGITFIFDCGFVWLVQVPLAFVLSQYTAMPFLLLYACCQAAALIKCTLGYIFLKQGKWIRCVVSDE
ncbi:MAG: MATE family efflux transporter [Ruminococcaceae bacterium]|nr:MATE family efflux transporter [Oscillospiraceae bacterium]